MILEHRWDMVKDDLRLYTARNFPTLGFGELIDRTFAPEKPWSFQHVMDMVGVLTVIYGAAKGIQGALGADDAAGTTRWTMPHRRRLGVLTMCWMMRRIILAK